MKHRQIVTLSVDFDLSKVPPPEQWEWDQVGVNLQGAAAVTVIASGPLQRVAEDA